MPPRHSDKPKRAAGRKPVKANARGRRNSHLVRLEGAAPGRAAGSGRSSPAELRQRVLQAALECFGAFGFAGTSTRAVAERAGVSHPLLLYHFQSKDGLWRSTMEDVCGRYLYDLEARLSVADPANPAEGLRAFIENFVQFSARVPQLHRIMTQQSTQGSERIEWLIEAHLAKSFAAICKLIERGQALGQVRQGDPARLYYAVIGLGGTLFSVSSEFHLLTGRDVFSPVELKQTMLQILDFLFV